MDAKLKRGMGVLAAILALLGFLLWSTLQARQFTCRVCVAYGGGENCATASAASEEDAARAAQVTACGTLARGRLETERCARTPPVSRDCARR